jgi:hypothetical protein
MSLTKFGKLVRKKSKAKTKGINIMEVFKYIEKYENFSKTNFGAFINGIFMGVVTDIVEEKTNLQCTQSQFWSIMDCFVGGANVGLETFYANLGGPDALNQVAENFKNDFDTLGKEGGKVDADPQVQTVVNDSEAQQSQPAQSQSYWSYYSGKAMDYLRDRYNKIYDSVIGKIRMFWEKLKALINSPLIQGIFSVSKCVIEKNLDQIVTGGLKLTLTFLGMGLFTKLVEAVWNLPMVFRKLYESFKRIYNLIMENKDTSQQRFYHYGKAIGDFFSTLAQIYNDIKKMKRFKHLFKN